MEIGITPSGSDNESSVNLRACSVSAATKATHDTSQYISGNIAKVGRLLRKFRGHDNVSMGPHSESNDHGRVQNCKFLIFFFLLLYAFIEIDKFLIHEVNSIICGVL